MSIDVVDLPEAIVDSNRTIQGVPVTVSDPVAGLLGNDDLGSDPTTITAFDAVSVNGGTVSVNPDGTYTCTPAAGFSGSDQFTYTITDDNCVSSTAIVTIIVDPLPVAEDDAASTVAGIGITVSDPSNGLLDNDDPGTGPTSVTAFDATSARGGTVVINTDGTYSYTPAPGFDGPDTFDYTITDVNGRTSTGTLNVAGVEDPEPPVTPETPTPTPVPPVTPADPPATPSSPSESGESIPRTGAESMQMMWLGALVLGAGLSLLLIGSRRGEDELELAPVASARSPWPAPNPADRS